MKIDRRIYRVGLYKEMTVFFDTLDSYSDARVPRPTYLKIRTGLSMTASGDFIPDDGVIPEIKDAIGLRLRERRADRI